VGLVDYATAFLSTEHEHVQFLWKSVDSHWLTVRLERAAAIPGRPASANVQWTVTALPAGLTTREMDVLTLVCLGLTNIQIAERLGNSSRTVSTQVERLLGKLDQKSRAGLAAIAVDARLLRLPLPGGDFDESGLSIVDVERAVHSRATLPAAPEGSAQSRPLRRPLRRSPFHIGSVLPLTGPSWADGLEAHRGAELAVAQINARGGINGRQVEHVVASADFFNPVEVASAFRSLVDLDVDAIITSYANAECPDVLDIVADFGQPFLHNATYEQQVEMVREDRDRFGMIFQTCPSEIHYGAGFVRLLDDLRANGRWNPSSRRLVAIELEAQSTHTANESFFRAAEMSGWHVADVAVVPLHNPDWRSVVTRIVTQAPAAVMITHFVPDALVDFQREFNEHGNDALIYGVYGPSIPEYQNAARGDSEGVIWSTVTGTYDDEFGRAFRRDFERLHGTPAGWSQASAAYDQVKLLSAAWSSTGSTDSAQVQQYLRSVVYRGVNGVYYLGGPGQAALSYPDVTPDPSIAQAHMVYQVQDGRPRVLGPVPYGDVGAFRTPPWFGRRSA
jgi:branched-chain amino acid transport system substrate-binding protein